MDKFIVSTKFPHDDFTSGSRILLPLSRGNQPIEGKIKSSVVKKRNF